MGDLISPWSPSVLFSIFLLVLSTLTAPAVATHSAVSPSQSLDSQAPPGVETLSPEEVTDWSATLRGNVSDLDSGENITVWFEYWRQPGGEVQRTDNKTLAEGGTFAIEITNLSADTDYQFIAYAETSGGTGSGEERSLSTEEDQVSEANAIMRRNHHVEIEVVREDLDGQTNQPIEIELASENLTIPKVGEKDTHVVFSQPIANLGIYTSLSDAEIIVRTADGRFSETLDLRYISFGERDKVDFDEDGRLLLPIKRAIGLGGTVTIAIDGRPQDLNLEANRQWLVVDREQLGENLDAYLGKTTFALPESSRNIAPSGSAGSIANVDLVNRVASNKISVTDNGLELRHPLFVQGLTYSFNVSTTRPAGLYIGQAEASSETLLIENPDLSGTSVERIKVWYDGRQMINLAMTSETNDGLITATVIDDGRTADNFSRVIQLDSASSLQSTSITELWIRGTVNRNATFLQLNESQFEVHQQDGRINLTGGHRLEVGGTYWFVLSSEGSFLGRVSTKDRLPQDSELSSIQTEGNESATGLPSGLGFLAVLFALAIVLLLGSLYWLAFRRGSSGTGVAATDFQHDVKVIFQDEKTNEPVTLSGELWWESTDSSSGKGLPKPTTTKDSKEIRNEQSGTIEALQEGNWEIGVQTPSRSVSKYISVNKDQTARLPISPGELEINVLDEESGQPVADAEVKFSPGEGEELRDITNEQGVVSFETPASSQQADVEVTHEYYEPYQETVSTSGGEAHSLHLSPRVGQTEVTVSMNGAPVIDVPVQLQTSNEFIQSNRDMPRSIRTDDNGRAHFHDLLVGEYRLRVEAGELGESFAGSDDTLKISEGTTTPVDLDIEFDYELSPAQRERVRGIREEIDQLGTSRGQDTLIPRYYGSVIDSLLSEIKKLPEYGHQFAGADIEPDQLTDVLLDVAAELTNRISAAMSSKRNGDLFEACATLDDTTVTWSDEYAVDELFSWLNEDAAERRRRVQMALDRVEERIGAEQGSLATLSPARAVAERVSEMIREMNGDAPVREPITLYAAHGLLGAVEELFEHDDIRERLKQTVF